ncbi:E3 SUMO-protein ligase ZBED1-like [Epinephelus moara]|uniref:E3 SUMO-protein ligase ZBED1-like n=1 Tax=Epinephelus moara TaxID=300413 RepID=UPI00214F5BC6|nr:E3 SUMO-protein ligase ZBED1-like [Epinephelus moara]
MVSCLCASMSARFHRIESNHMLADAAEVEGAGSAAAAESIVWSYFHEDVEGTVSARNPTADAVMEVRAYLQEPLVAKNEGPLKWWESRVPVYPRLSKLMAKKLCVVATSVPSERIFSKTGQIISEKRSRLKPAKVRSLVFLNANLPKDKRDR